MSNLPTLPELMKSLSEHCHYHDPPSDSPSFLFRGESCDFMYTHSSMDRHFHSLPVHSETYNELEKITAYIMQTPFVERALGPREAAAYGQHYGFPTQVVDFTASLHFAANFAKASFGSPRQTSTGFLGFLDVRQACQSEHCELFDLRQHPTAKRAHKQAAYGLVYSRFIEDGFVDLKRSDIAGPLGLRWLLFRHEPEELDYLEALDVPDDLLDTSADSFAGLAEEMLDMYIAERGRVVPETACILASTIPALSHTKDENLQRWSRRVD